MHFNIRSLPSKFSELKQIINRLDVMNVRLHCIMLCETFLTDNNYVHYNISGYNLVCRNRQTGKRGGVAMYIRDDLNYIYTDIIFPLLLKANLSIFLWRSAAMTLVVYLVKHTEYQIPVN